MYKSIYCLLFCTLFNLPAVAFANKLSPIPEHFQYCTVCHGAQFKGNQQTGAPRLSGLQEWYLSKQLFAFNKTWRGSHADDISGHEMRAAAEPLSDELIAQASLFVSTTQAAPAESTLQGDLIKGQELYLTCSVCHGQKAEGSEQFAAPALVGLNDWYIVKQLQNFNMGLRGTHPEDNAGKLMKDAVAQITDEESMIDLATYITNINKQEKK